MFGWWTKRKRKRIAAEPFPLDWRVRLELDVALWPTVPEQLRPKLEDDLRFFVAERSWEPCGGMSMDEEQAAVIAAQACLLTLGRSVDAFDHVGSIIVYPTTYWAPDEYEDEAGIVTEDVDQREGEASHWGTVVLSWQDVIRDSRTLNGRNLVLHELAHQIDLLDHLPPEVPGGPRAAAARWRETFLDRFEWFCGEVDAGRRVKGLDEYGAEDEAEFFAVASESFFERPRYLKEHHPELYGVLAGYYALDPAAWPPAPKAKREPGKTGRERRRQRRERERKLRKDL